MKFIVEKTTPLLDALAYFMPKTSRSKLRKMLTEGRIQINGEVEHRAKTELPTGTEIEVLSRVKALEITPPPASKQKKSNLTILWEDDAILVVEKPAGLLSIATDKLERDTLHARCVDHIRLEDEKNWCYIVHRLDRDTSGIMVFALHQRHKEYLQTQFAEREVHRTYHALVEGRPRAPCSGTVARAWLVEDQKPPCKESQTIEFPWSRKKRSPIGTWLKTTDDEVSLLHITIETGRRRHQIRMALKVAWLPGGW